MNIEGLIRELGPIDITALSETILAQEEVAWHEDHYRQETYEVQLGVGPAAVAGEINSSALLLFLIIFVWTPPHFWALAIARKEEYEKVGIPMLPVTHGDAYTRLNILLYTILLVLITIIPYLTGMSGLVYLATVVILDARFLWYAVQMRRVPDDLELPMRMFKFSITYLGVLFAALLVDHYFLFQLSL